jgi:hypothetical protein
LNQRVNILRVKKKEGRHSLARDWSIEIDREDLTNLLDPSKSWPERRDVMVNTDALKRSVNFSGDYPILICAHCAESNFVSPDDVGLKPVRVTVSSDIISWEIQFTEASGRGEETFQYSFHRPQYEGEVAKVLVFSEGSF